ncbi:MAG: type VI secretion system tube protein Hcp [Desulfatitalea sp.]|nr:type VI secretion system tube protein Hcp [Desulfatitalea sp.]
MFDGFIQIKDIAGESTDQTHAEWIEIQDFNVSVNQTVSKTASSVGGAGAERADFSEFNFTKLLDTATPKLALACAAGTHIDTIVVDLCRAGGDKMRFMQYRFTNCLISSFTSSADGGFPQDEVTFAYDKIEWHYTRQKRQGGGPAGNLATGWHLAKNCKA